MNSKIKEGVIYAALSYLLWGVLPLYWRLIEVVPPFEILAHRILWAFVFVTILLGIKGEFKKVIEILKSKKSCMYIFLSGTMVTINWGLYIWAVNSHHIVEASLGYYINPLIVVAFGVIFLKEKLTKSQIISLAIALIGVIILTIQYGKVPWISLALAISFALYGLLKKLTNAGSMVSLGLETTMVMPFALAYILFRQLNGVGALGNITSLQTVLLICSGIVTAVPLILFAKGTKRIPLATLGFVQYISPTMSLMIGVFLFNESFTTVDLISFSCIWASLLIYSFSELIASKKHKHKDKDII